MPAQLTQLLLPLGLLAFFWFFMIRPQQQQQKKRREMLDALKKGDQVVTIGGVHGTVIDLDPDTAKLQVAPNVQITFSRGAIGSVKSGEEATK